MLKHQRCYMRKSKKKVVVIDLQRKLHWSADRMRLALSGHSRKGCALPLQGERAVVPAKAWRC